MSSPILELQHLSVGYFGPRNRSNVVAENLTLRLYSGELVCLLGPNGAGKSTLMRTVAAMQKPLAGKVVLEGCSVDSMSKLDLARRLSVVLTERVTIGMLTAYDLVALGRSPYTGWSGALSKQDHAIIEQSIRAVGAEALAHRHVSELSDGERQKIMLARALAQEPEVMILDEITAFLDLPRRVEIMQILRELAHRRGRAILLSTHDLELALSNADRVWLMPKGGSLVAGVPEDLVLNGQFSSAFASEGVHFDEEAGTFLTHRTFSGEIALSAEGSVARWTRRALERNGYRVTSSGRVMLKVTQFQDRPIWELCHENGREQRGSIEEILNVLRTVTIR